MRSRVEAVGTVRLILDTGHHLDLEYTFFFTSVLWFQFLEIFWFYTNFLLLILASLWPFESQIVGSGLLLDGLYRLKFYYSFQQSLITLHGDVPYGHVHVRTKGGMVKKNSSMPLHRRLGHISKRKIRRLVGEGVLCTLDFTVTLECAAWTASRESRPKPPGLEPQRVYRHGNWSKQGRLSGINKSIK